MTELEKKISFWTSIPGILTGVAAIITAVTGLYIAINSQYKVSPSLSPPHNNIVVSARPDCKKFGITIDQKSQEVQDLQADVVVSGDAQELPTHLHLWVAATVPGGLREFWPRDEVQPKGGRWQLKTTAELKNSDDVKRFAVFVVGEEGHKAIADHKAASKATNNWVPMNEDEFAMGEIVRCHGIHMVKVK